jgi:putative membrane protein
MTMGRATAVFLVALAWPSIAEAHVGGTGDGWDTAIVCGLVASVVLYGTGVFRLWRRAGWGQGVNAWQAASFLLGWTTIAIALLPPLERLSDEMFAAHMVEHELLMIVAAPLLVVARPLGAMLWALPIALRRALGGLPRSRLFASAWTAILHPGIAWTVHAAALWLWHAPALFQAALAHPGIHALQHLCFLGAALLYWWSLLRPAARAYRGVSVLSLFGTTVHSSLLGALIALSQVVWYPLYAGSQAPFGLTALEDQQLAGFIMWVPGALVYVGAALRLLYESLSGASLRSGHVARG